MLPTHYIISNAWLDPCCKGLLTACNSLFLALVVIGSVSVSRAICGLSVLIYQESKQHQRDKRLTVNILGELRGEYRNDLRKKKR